jgi:hypothetical protein
VTILGLLSALGCGFVLYFSKGLVALDTFDFWVGSVLILVLALVQALLYGWVFGTQRGHREIHEGAHMHVPWLVQVMLKWVVPGYLLAIFAGFCFINLPSHDTLKFTAHRVEVGDFAEGAVSEALRSQFTSHDLTLPATAKLRRGDEGGAWAWQVLDSDGNVPFVIGSKKTGLEIYTHEMGYVEKIGSSPVAFASLLFVIANLAFLLLMVHIAGRRWEAQGRFDNLPAG